MKRQQVNILDLRASKKSVRAALKAVGTERWKIKLLRMNICILLGDTPYVFSISKYIISMKKKANLSTLFVRILRWEFIKENKKVRKQENTLSTKKAFKKKNCTCISYLHINENYITSPQIVFVSKRDVQIQGVH